MTKKIFIIGFGGAGKNFIKNVKLVNNNSFTLRTLNISNNGNITQKNQGEAWRKFFDASIPSFDLIYDNLDMDPLRFQKDCIDAIQDFHKHLPNDCKVALVAGLGGFVGSQSIITFATKLGEIINDNLFDCAAFVTTPFNFEGAKRSDTSDKVIGKLKTLLPRENIYVTSNQGTFKNAGPKTTFIEAFLQLDNEKYKQICAHFSLKMEPMIEPQKRSKKVNEKQFNGLKTISEAAKTLELEAHVLRFYETKIDTLNPVQKDKNRFYNDNDIKLMQSIKYFSARGKPLAEINDLINEKGIDHVIALTKEKGSHLRRNASEKAKDQTANGNHFDTIQDDRLVNYDAVDSAKKSRRSKFQILSRLLISISVIFVLIVLGSIWQSFSQLSNKQLHAAITQPNVLINITDDTVNLRNCICERTLQPLELPETFTQALVAIEDKRFYQHNGIDFISLARAISGFGRRGGGSTIEMQLVKNSIVQPQRDLFRKFQELIFAYRLKSVLSKDDILRLYASRVNFGNIGARQINGLRSASNYYLNKKPEDLNAYEAAILVAMLKSPKAYHPIKKIKNNRGRASLILKVMGGYSEEDIEKFSLSYNKPNSLGFKKPARDRYLEDFIVSEVRQLKLKNGSYRLILTIDPIAQWQATNILSDEIYKNRKKNVERGSLVSINENGAIKALVGGQNYQKNSFNLATQAERPAASTFKIVTYLAALEKGFTAKTTVYDDLEKLTTDHKPKNYDNKYAGATSLENCFIKSKNVCTVDIASRLLKFEPLSDVAARLRITNKPVEGINVILGTLDTTLVRNTAAFATIKNKGLYKSPILIRFVLTKYGQVSLMNRSVEDQVIKPFVTSEMSKLLEKVVSPDGTAANAALLSGYKTYGKTGTSDDYKDAWFIGWSEHLITTGIWVGPPENETMLKVSGGSLPAKIFRRFNENMYERYEFCTPDFTPQSSGYGRDVNC